MAKNLVIVESPAKARTISGYLGSDYVVTSSMGHIRDLPKKGMSVDIENDFAPHYEVSADKKKIVTELRKQAKAADTVWLASDEDREGEAIAWHLQEALGLKKGESKRIVFHEITKPAILAAIENPRDIDDKLVDAQQARRILDRLVGYELSPVLWRKVRPGLSAGRVQSVAVRLIVEREREIKDFTAEESYKLTAEFVTDNKELLPAEGIDKAKDKESAQATLEKLKDAKFTVADIATKPGTRNPGTPFTTSSLQQEASRRIGFSPKTTMMLAQRLYEAGHITYMRTDSLNLSPIALSAMKDFIIERYGEQYYQARTFKTKKAGAQEAHEAIRPTDFTKTEAGMDDAQRKLYRLIWQRTMASQMVPAKMEKTVVTITADNNAADFKSEGEVLVFDGFMKVTGRSGEDSIVPKVTVGEKLEYNHISATQTFSRGNARYTEASLVKALEDLGIGRPSTYAPTISTIQDRGYVEKRDVEGVERQTTTIKLEKGIIQETAATSITGADKNKLVPTAAADVVTDFLVKNFPEVIDYDFTASLEGDFDKIADGKKTWVKVLKDFYGPFRKDVDKSADIDRSEVAQARQIGTDPKSGRPIFSRFGRFGPMLQIGEASDDVKPVFAPMPAGATIDTVTLEQALKMFQLPRVVGTTEDGEEIKANIGRFGPYVQVGKMYVSIKPEDPHTINEASARKFIADKKAADAAKHIQTFEKEGINVLNGRYGPYITDGTKNAKIPKDKDPAKLTLEECQAILAATPDKKKFGKKKTPSKKTSSKKPVKKKPASKKKT
jgi:DNA topoisomerase-1